MREYTPTPGQALTTIAEAEQLLAMGYHRAAAMTARLALEQRIRQLSRQRNLRLRRTDRAVYLMEQAGAITPEDAATIRRLMKAGGEAAHKGIAPEQAAALVEGVRRLC